MRVLVVDDALEHAETPSGRWQGRCCGATATPITPLCIVI
jgi:hypothetical protein